MRLIDADALKGKVLEWMPSDPCGIEEREFPFEADIVASLMMEIEEAPTIEPEPHWIPCSERLPKKEKKTYWVCTDTEYQCECRRVNNRFGLGEGEWGWSIFDTPPYSKPIAWMPLPEPYKTESEDKE